MDYKVKYSLLFLFILFIILSSGNNIAYKSLLTLSLTTIFYNVKSGVSIYLLLGFTGIYFATLLRNSVETFQDNQPTTTSTNTYECNGDQSLKLTLKDFKELGFLFDALFQINEDKMRVILREKCITDIFSLKNYIEFYRNQSDDDIDIKNWAYSNKALTLSRLIPIYMLQPEDMVTLINREKVTYLQLEESPELRNKLFGVNSVITLGMKYYFKEKKLTKKHYKILTSLGLTSLLPESIRENLESLLVTQRYYDYKIKDIINLVILFEHLEYLNNEDLTADWGNEDTNGDEWIKIKLIQIDLSSRIFKENELFKNYTISERIEKFLFDLEEEERERIARETINFSKPLSDKDTKEKLFKARNNIIGEEINEYHSQIIENLEGNEDDVVNDVTIDFNNVDKLLKKSNNTLTGVIDEIIILYNNVSNTNYSPDNKINNLVSKYLVFVKELMNIITRDQRLLFVGLFIMILAVIFSLIEINL